MRIETITSPAPPKQYWTLILEDGTQLRAYPGAMADFALHRDMDLSDEQVTSLRRAASLSKLRERAVNMLSLRPHARGELRAKLLQKGAEEAQAEEVMDWAETIGLLSDADYAKTLVRHYGEKGYGPYKIRGELHRHQVPKELWDEALCALPVADTAIDAYLARHLHSTERKDIKRASDALARRGHSWSDISDGLRRHRLTEEDDEV